MPGLEQLAINPPPKVDDPSQKSTWYHRAWVATGLTTVLVSLANSIVGPTDLYTWLKLILAGFIGYLFADLGTGVYHWAIDNYGNASTPIFGSNIDAFQSHHKWPSNIPRRQFANHSYELARFITLTVLPLNLILHDKPVVMGFVGMTGGCIMFSQQFHVWAHRTKTKLPTIVVALQDAGVLVSRSQHAAHHRPPYNKNYCIVSGIWNKFLEEHRVFETLENMVFLQFGIRPRSWDELNFDGMEEVVDSSPTTVS